jgi:hypothetical protein
MRNTKRAASASTPARAPDPSDEYLTTEEAARILKRSSKTFEFWRLVGQGPPFYRQGRLIRYLRSEVMAWGASHRVANENLETKPMQRRA